MPHNDLAAPSGTDIARDQLMSLCAGGGNNQGWSEDAKMPRMDVAQRCPLRQWHDGTYGLALDLREC